MTNRDIKSLIGTVSFKGYEFDVQTGLGKKNRTTVTIVINSLKAKKPTDPATSYVTFRHPIDAEKLRKRIIETLKYSFDEPRVESRLKLDGHTWTED